MDTITIIACSGDAWYSDIIKAVSHGRITHIAGLVLGSTLEASGVKGPHDRYPGVWLHPPDEYVPGPDYEFLTLPIQSLAAAEEKARELIGTPYSFHGCIEAGLEMLFDLQPPVDGELTMMCSETWTHILQAGGPIGYALPDIQADFVAPQRLYDAVKGAAI